MYKCLDQSLLELPVPAAHWALAAGLLCPKPLHYTVQVELVTTLSCHWGGGGGAHVTLPLGSEGVCTLSPSSAHLPTGQLSPGNLQSGQTPSKATRHMPQSVSFVHHFHTATALHLGGGGGGGGG